MYIGFSSAEVIGMVLGQHSQTEGYLDTGMSLTRIVPCDHKDRVWGVLL